MKVRIFWSVVGLTLSDSGPLSFRSLPMTAYAQGARIENLFSRAFKFSVGGIGLDRLRESVVLYCEFDVPEAQMGSFQSGLIHALLQEIRNHLGAIWISQDNAVDVYEMYVELKRGAQTEVDRLYANRLMLSSTGSTKEVSLSLSRLSDIFEFSDTRVRPHFEATEIPLMPTYDSMAKGDFTRLVAQKGISRFTRFWTFLRQARSTGDLGIKMVNYCTALEAMFATGQEGVTRQISERAAAFLSDRNKTQKEIGYHVREAYDVRSSVVHGSVVDAVKMPGLEKMCTRTDQFLREITTKYLDSTDLQKVYSNEGSLEEYLKSLDRDSGP